MHVAAHRHPGWWHRSGSHRRRVFGRRRVVWRRPSVPVLAAVAVVLWHTGPGCPVAGAGPWHCSAAPSWRAPVDAPTVLGFSLPNGPYGAGNRGLEYDVPSGTVVRAVAPGVVTFAGTIAGERYVAIRHDPHRVSSYSYLASIDVRTGDAVPGGGAIGTGAGRLQLGVRVDGAYVDPAPLLRGGGRLRPRLVPPATVPPPC